jgi:hypothetical protein
VWTKLAETSVPRDEPLEINPLLLPTLQIQSLIAQEPPWAPEQPIVVVAYSSMNSKPAGNFYYLWPDATDKTIHVVGPPDPTWLPPFAPSTLLPSRACTVDPHTSFLHSQLLFAWGSGAIVVWTGVDGSDDRDYRAVFDERYLHDTFPNGVPTGIAPWP